MDASLVLSGENQGPWVVWPGKSGVAVRHWDKQRDVTIAFTHLRACREVPLSSARHLPTDCIELHGGKEIRPLPGYFFKTWFNF